MRRLKRMIQKSVSFTLTDRLCERYNTAVDKREDGFAVFPNGDVCVLHDLN